MRVSLIMWLTYFGHSLSNNPKIHSHRSTKEFCIHQLSCTHSTLYHHKKMDFYICILRHWLSIRHLLIKIRLNFNTIPLLRTNVRKEVWKFFDLKTIILLTVSNFWTVYTSWYEHEHQQSKNLIVFYRRHVLGHCFFILAYFWCLYLS